MTDATSYAAAASARLDRLWQRGRDFLGTRTAVMGGAMSWVSERHLVSAISNAGGFGVLACGSMAPDQLAVEIAGTRALTDRPFGVNLINMHPALDRLIDVCREQAVGHVVVAGGLPTGATLRRIKDGGARAMAFAPTLGAGRRLVKQGADALVIEGTEAGGHIGPVSTTVLAQEILPDLRDVPVFVAGGIGRARRSSPIWSWGRPACRSAPASSAPPNAWPMPISSRPSSGRRPATPSRRCRSTRVSR